LITFGFIGHQDSDRFSTGNQNLRLTIAFNGELDEWLFHYLLLTLVPVDAGVRRHVNYVFSDNYVMLVGTRIACSDTFSSRYWLSTPGPIYCANTDNCGTGPIVAPNNVSLDKEGYEIIFRQPANDLELQQVLEAADADPFDGYRFDGNTRWTSRLVDDWIANKKRLIDVVNNLLRSAEKLPARSGQLHLSMYSHWLEFIHNGLDDYLSGYKAGLSRRDA
jgi:hypothetical protein